MNATNCQLILLLLLFASCTRKPAEQAGPNTVAHQETSSCYRYAANKDTVQLQIRLKGDSVSGNLDFNFFEKDDNTGTIDGMLKGDTIFADYTFMSEGTLSVREVAFLRKGDYLVQGYGEVTDQNGKFGFHNRGELVFDNTLVLDRTSCQ